MLHQMQRGRRPEAVPPSARAASVPQACRWVPCRNSIGTCDIGKMLGPLVGWLVGRMQRKAQERQSADAGERRDRLRLRRHASAERLAAGDQPKPGTAPRGFRHRGPHRGVSDRRFVGPLAAGFHVGKLITQRRHAALAKPGRDRFHGGMGHSGARAMGKDKTRARLRRQDREAPRPGPHSRFRFSASARCRLSSHPPGLFRRTWLRWKARVWRMPSLRNPLPPVTRIFMVRPSPFATWRRDRMEEARIYAGAW